MNSQTLREARKYEEASEKMIREEERPSFHLSTRTGWMNDPNGFSFYKGEYHLFYQYNPYSTQWDAMHWGHAVSSDLLKWKYLPAALAPDEAYDRDGCFSGSAIELPDERQLLMYTGAVRQRKPDGSLRDIQTQCLAIGDGEDYTKYSNNPVLDEQDLPKGCSKVDFRDPKLWKGEDGIYYCVVGNRPADGTGQILLFSSRDGLEWNYESIFAENKGRFGKMWECPDYFELDGKGVLVVSPQDMLPEGLEYHNGNGTLCLIGEFDPVTKTFQEQYNQSIDYGIDFYAPQTVLAPDGRRIMIGWMQNWDTCNHSTDLQKWFGQMSLPRELSVKNGRLYQKPVRELEAMRRNKVSYTDVTIEDGNIRLEGIRGRKIDMEVTLHIKEMENPCKKIVLYFAQDEKNYTSLSFRPYESVLKIDRKFSGSRRALIHQRRCQVNGGSQELKLRLILDRYSVEIFINEGEQVMSATLYTDQAADGISFFADGSVKMDVTKYDLD